MTPSNRLIRPTSPSATPLRAEPGLEQRYDGECPFPHMGEPAHPEQHSSYGAVIRDGIIGFADGLTVPFALTAGLSSLGSTKLVVIGGIAELFSGAISMGLGGYLAAATEREHYLSEEAREWDEIKSCPDVEREEVYQILGAYHVSREAATPLVDSLCRNPEQWVRFMMDFELQLEKPNVNRVWISALTMGLSYFIGGLIPMIPYFVMDEANKALFVSIGITIVILLAFGYLKNWVTIRNKRAGFWGALQTLVVGVVAAGTSYAIVRAVDSHTGA
jgi:vacuolar iron transporter family protein